MLSLAFVTRWILSRLFPCFGMFKMSFLMFNSIHQIWYPVRRDTQTYVRRILNTPCMQKFINAHFAPFPYYGAKLIVDTVNSQYFSKGDFIIVISELYQAFLFFRWKTQSAENLISSSLKIWI